LKKFFQIYFVIIVLIAVGASCTVKKRKNETSAAGKFYHNMTSYYNGYWNAKEILRESILLMRNANVDDYNKILEVEDFTSLNNPKMVKTDMDKIIQKVTTVAQLHEPGDWVDDCYVMMGKAQYLKQEYETAEETLVYFQEDFNPKNPYGRNYKSKKPTGKRAKKLKEAERKEKEVSKKEKEKSRAQQAKEKAKEKADEKKAKEKQRKIDAKNKKKGIKKTPTQTKTGSDTPATPTKTDVNKNISESQQNRDEEPYVPPTPPKPEDDKTAYYEGLLWLAKTYIKRENWFAAQLLLEKVMSSGASEEIKNQVPATYANLYLKQKRYDEALVSLNEAIEIESDKQLKARYAFISGQIHQMNSNYEQAFVNYTLSKKWARDPRMEFMSELAISKSGIAARVISKDKVTQDLLKMANNDKYINFRDQLYFTLAEIELSLNNETNAIEYFSLSALNNNNDKKLKGS
jgi:tetratricopeptide (TPR) repeat protein